MILIRQVWRVLVLSYMSMTSTHTTSVPAPPARTSIANQKTSLMGNANTARVIPRATAGGLRHPESNESFVPLIAPDLFILRGRSRTGVLRRHRAFSKPDTTP